MIDITTNLLVKLFDVFGVWLTLEPIKVLVSLLVVGYVCKLFVGLVTYKN